jgi:hypothetical protein
VLDEIGGAAAQPISRWLIAGHPAPLNGGLALVQFALGSGFCFPAW